MEQVVFAHVSDPHFADPCISPQPIMGVGKNGHDLVLCKALVLGLEMLRERTEFPAAAILPVVMSGDLTRTGMNPAEFAVGNQYFQATWPNPMGVPVEQFGLQLGNEKRNYVRIPGNHDHWDGDTKNQWGYNAAIKPVHMPNTIFRRTMWDASVDRNKSKLIVELYGVDSGSGFPPIGSRRNRRARGRISQPELNRLNRALSKSIQASLKDENLGIRRVRVIVCHHSFQGNWIISWFGNSLELESDSRKALEYAAGRYHVAAILTGHAHDFLADRYYLRTHARWLCEFRSATTLQAPARYFKQGFFGHRIALHDDGSITWSAYPFEWQGSYFFPLPIEEGTVRPGFWNPFYFNVT